MPPPAPLPEKEVHRSELWVDAFSPAGGDGTKEHPFKTVPSEVARDVLVNVASGVYEGSISLAPGAWLEGTGEVVLTAPAGQPVLTLDGARARHLSIQGGSVGLVAKGDVMATGLHFSGQRARAVSVEGSLTLGASELEATVEGIEGVVVARGGDVTLTDVTLRGGFRRGVQTEGGSVRLLTVKAEGVKTLVHAVEGLTDLQKVRTSGGAGPAIFAAGGRVMVAEAEVLGHEYAVQLARGAQATVSDLRARGAQSSCVSVTNASLSLLRSVLADCGGGGALFAQQSKVTLSGVEVTSAREVGVLLRGGELRVLSLSVSGVSGSDGALGDALHVREGKVLSEGGSLTASNLDGSAIFASAFADVQLDQVTVERARGSAFFVERKAKLQVRHALVRGGAGPALVVPDAATARFDALFVAGGTESPIYAECAQGAEVALGKLESTVPQVPSRCVTVTR